MITAEQVLALRNKLGSRRALAEATGLSEGKIWRIEKKGVIHDDERAAIERFLGGEAVEVPRPTPQVEEPAPSVAQAAVVSEPIEIDLAELSRLAAHSYGHYFSNSEFRTFKRCRRKWWLAWHRGLRLIAESPIGVRQVGDRIHRALKTHYAPGGPASPVALLEALEREILLDRQALPNDVDADTLKKFSDEADLQRIMLEGYLQWLAETGADSDIEVIAPETYLEAPLGWYGTDVAIIGKIDVRVRRKTDDVHLFIDHKTVANLVQPTLMLPLDEQMLHYHLLEALQADNEERCEGALYNMLRRVKRTARAQPPFYARNEVRHNQRELDSYRGRAEATAYDIMDVKEKLADGDMRVVYPNPTRDCTWDCPFVSVCPMFDDGSRAEALLEQYFVAGDPLNYYMRDVIGENE